MWALELGGTCCQRRESVDIVSFKSVPCEGSVFFSGVHATRLGRRGEVRLVTPAGIRAAKIGAAGYSNRATRARRKNSGERWGRWGIHFTHSSAV